MVSRKEDNIINTIGKFVYSKRKDNQMTVMEFAKNVGISPSFVSKLENDMLKPETQILENISDVLMLNKEEYVKFLELSQRKQTITTEAKNFILENLKANKSISSLIRITVGLDISNECLELLLANLKNLI